MALGRRKPAEPATVTPDTAAVEPAPPVTPEPAPRRRAITAAAAVVQMDGVGWRTWKFGDQAWQSEAWRMYDIVGELRKYANWIGAAVSRCRLYVAEVDGSGEGLVETEDPAIAGLASGPLGSGPAKDESLRLMGVNLAVVGEAYIVAEARDGADDLWYVVSGGEIKGSAGAGITITRPAMFGLDDELKFRPGVDLLIRCWTPHPRRTAWADSSVRAAIPVLRKIETTMKRSFAELDSRLAGAGILLLPEGVDFPRGDDDPEGVDGLTQRLQAAMLASIQDRSSAAAMVPIMATVPADAVDKIKLVTFWSELSDKIQEMEDASIRRLAIGLDLPPEQLLGMGQSNHWCHSMDTEVYAQSHGWLGHTDLRAGMHVLSLNHETGLSEWRPVTDVYTADVTDEPMLSLDATYHSSLTTLGHRWPVLQPTRPRNDDGSRRQEHLRQWATSADLLADERSEPNRRHIPIAAPHADTPTTAKHDDAMVTLLAWASTDADLTPQRKDHRRALRIRQRNTDSVGRIRRCLDQVGIGYKESTEAGPDVTVFRLSAGQTERLLDYGRVLGHRFVVSRDVVDEFTESQLHAFLAVCVEANGHGRQVFAVDADRLDPVEHAAILLGYRVSRGRRNQQSGFGTTPVAWVSWGSRTTFNPGPEHRSQVSYTGTIWCPAVDGTHTYLARRNGRAFFTGNSLWGIEESTIRICIEPVLARIADALTTGYLRAALDLSDADPARFVYAFDTSPLSQRPDRTADGVTYHTAGLISDDAARRSGAYDIEDAPTADERLRRLVESVIPSMPQLLGDPAIQRLLGLPAISIGAADSTVPAVGESAPPRAEEPRALPERAEPEASLLAVANLAVLHALGRAGIRLVAHRQRDQWSETLRHQLHTRHGPVGREHADAVLRGAWDDLPSVAADLAVDAAQLQAMLHGFCVELLTRGMAYDPGLLRDLVGAAVRGRRLNGPVKAVS